MPKRFWDYQPSRNQRLSPELYAVVGQPCFFTIRCAKGMAPFAQKRLADIAVRCLLEQRSKSQCQVDVYCVMPDHVHVVVTPAVEGASSLTFIDRFKGWCSRELRLAGWVGPVWQPRSYEHLIRADEDIHQIGVYMLGNPVRRGLCSDTEDYAWSGIPDPLPFPPDPSTRP